MPFRIETHETTAQHLWFSASQDIFDLQFPGQPKKKTVSCLPLTTSLAILPASIVVHLSGVVLMDQWPTSTEAQVYREKMNDLLRPNFEALRVKAAWIFSCHQCLQWKLSSSWICVGVASAWPLRGWSLPGVRHLPSRCDGSDPGRTPYELINWL